MLKYTDNIFRILHNPWVTHAHFYQKIFTNNKYLTWICNCSQKKRPKKPAVNSVQQYCLYPLPLRLFLCLFLPPSLSLSLPTHALCPLYPLNNTLSLFACVLLFVYPQVCVCVWKSFEDSGEPSACLVCTQNRSHWGASTQKQQCYFVEYLILCNCPSWQFSEWGAIVRQEIAALNSSPTSLHGINDNNKTDRCCIFIWMSLEIYILPHIPSKFHTRIQSQCC